MSIASTFDRPTLRRAQLRSALRRGDVVSAARAWERLRLEGVSLTPQELAGARSARRTLGRAIREARQRRATPDSPLIAVRRLRRYVPGRKWMRALVAVAAVITIIDAAILVSILGGVPLTAEQPAAAPPAPLVATPVHPSIGPAGRGRISDEFAFIAAPTAQPTALPSPSPAGSPAASPSGAAGGQASGSPGSQGTVPGAVPGIGGGTRTAVPLPSATPTPTPIPVVTPPPLAAGMDRFTFLIRDSRTGLAVPGVCVAFGTGGICNPDSPVTDARGITWKDLDRSDARAWEVAYLKTGYLPQGQRLTHVSGRNQQVNISLRRS